MSKYSEAMRRFSYCITPLLVLAALFPLDAESTPSRSVFLEDLTSPEVESFLEKGAGRVIVATGGVEQNGPWVVLGKHNYILHHLTERIARELGETVVSPIVKFVPEGGISPKTEHMLHAGTISVRDEVFEALLEDIVRSHLAHGFRQVALLGDSGGNQAGMARVVSRMNDPRVIFIREFYDYEEVSAELQRQGVRESGAQYHETLPFTAQLAVINPDYIRHAERVVQDGGVLNGVPLQPLEKLKEIGERIIGMRVKRTVSAISKRGISQ